VVPVVVVSVVVVSVVVVSVVVVCVDVVLLDVVWVDGGCLESVARAAAPMLMASPTVTTLVARTARRALCELAAFLHAVSKISFFTILLPGVLITERTNVREQNHPKLDR
jgi:hypothetical protein